MRFSLSRPSPALVVAVVALVAATGGWALAAIPARDGSITACYAKSNGALRVVDAKKKCKRTEKRLTFNQQGQDGKNGAPGAAGTNGANGTNGTDGTNGTNGTDGTNGTNGTNGTDGTNATIPPVEGRHVVGQAGQPGFESTWTTSIGFAAPSFYKDRDGIVHLEGHTFHQGGANTAFEGIFTLPAGYRPAADQRFAVPTATAGTQTTLRVEPSGKVSPEPTGIDGGTISMDGVTFRAEQ